MTERRQSNDEGRAEPGAAGAAGPDGSEVVPREEDVKSGRYLPYPNSTLSPRILPNDLTSHKSRGIATVEKFFQERLRELREEYLELVDQFNWNKLIYEARYGFEPLIGNCYHLYASADGYTLSMIEPEKWPGKRWIGSFRLQADGQWSAERLADDFDLREVVGEHAGER